MMKKILMRIFDKKRFVFVFGLLIGVVLMGGVSRGLDEYTSAGVSYTGKDGKTTTVKAALDDLIGKSLTKIDTLEKQVADLGEKTKVYKYAKLAEVAKQGDYVAYDAGTWGTAAAKPTSQGTFGGNGTGNKGNSVAWCSSSSYTTSLKGWRVLKNDGTTVTLVHAGQPECYYHVTDQSGSVTKLNARAKEQYLNKIYATEAHAMIQAEANALDSSNTLRTTGDRYWLATPNSSSSYSLYFVNPDSSIGSSRSDSFGFRPVVVLKSTVLTTGRGTDQVGNPDAWILA